MKKFFLFLSLVSVGAFCYHLTSAQIKQEITKNTRIRQVRYLAPINYYPISEIENINTPDLSAYKGVFDKFIADFCNEHTLKCEPFVNKDFITTTKTIEKNKLDFVIGIYSDSTLYEDFKFIYPSLLDNPVHLVMLPQKINQIKNIKDLKKLKGAIESNEQWNDYILEQFKQLKIEKINTAEEMYKKLLSGEIDYVLTTYWYSITKIMKLGIQDFVAVSQKGLWNMPLFIAISNFSSQKNYLVHYMTEHLKNPETTEKIKERALEILEEIKMQNQGVVPDSYILQKDNK